MPGPTSSGARVDGGQIKVGLGRRSDVRFGGPAAIGFVFRGPIDVGQGANPWAFSTLQLPMYTPIGGGVPNKRNFATIASSGVMWAKQGMTLTTLGNPGNITGSFVSQPLVNVDAPKTAFDMPAFAAGSFLIPTG